jgi:hydroxymethylpyrimidine pyrophosphatase-like HAD family hydrolase
VLFRAGIRVAFDPEKIGEQEMTLIKSNFRGTPSILLGSDCDGTTFENLKAPAGAGSHHEQRENDLAMHTFRRMAEMPGVTTMFVTGRNIRELHQGCKHYGFEGIKLPFVGVDTGLHVYECQNGDLRFDNTFNNLVSEQALALGWNKPWLMRLFNSQSISVIHPTQDSETQDPDSLKVQWVVRDMSRMEEFKGHVDQAIRYSCHGAAVAISSFDPAKQLGFLDVMPIYRFENPGNPELDPGVTGKVIALEYIRRRVGLPVDRVAYSGDSGNDTAALVRGYYGTLVENASEQVRNLILQSAKLAGTENTLFLPTGPWRGFSNSGCLRGVLRGAIEHARFFDPDIIFESKRDLFGR